MPRSSLPSSKAMGLPGKISYVSQDSRCHVVIKLLSDQACVLPSLFGCNTPVFLQQFRLTTCLSMSQDQLRVYHGPRPGELSHVTGRVFQFFTQTWYRQKQFERSDGPCRLHTDENHNYSSLSVFGHRPVCHKVISTRTCVCVCVSGL